MIHRGPSILAGVAFAALGVESASAASVPTPDDPIGERPLDLDRETRANAGPALVELTTALREEIRRLDRGEPTAAEQVSRALRERAVLLLEARGGEAEIAALAGLRLAISRQAVDRFAAETMAATSDLDMRRLAAWRAMLLARFADRSLEDLRDAVAGRRGLDGPLARSMTPLLEAMIAGTDHLPGDHWPAAAADTERGDDRPPVTIAAPRIGTANGNLAAFPETAARYGSWRSRAERRGVSVRSIDAIGDAIGVLVAADHLPMPLRERLLADVAARLGDPSDPDEDFESGIAPRVRWILAVAGLLDAIDGAAQRTDRSRRSRSMLVDRVLRPLATTGGDTEVEDPPEALLQAAAILEAATLASRIAERPIRRELQATRTTLRRRAIEAESRWISTFADRPGASGVDRAAARAAGLAHIADLERLEGLSRLADRVGDLEPRASVAAATRARDLASPLVEPLKRAEARERIDATLAASPLRPTSLDGGTPPLAEADALRSRLEGLRRDWIAAWIDGDAGTTSKIESEVGVLRDLLAISAKVVALGTDATGGSLGRQVVPWGAWWVRPDAIDAAVGTLAPRVGLATAAWLRGDLAGAERSLVAIGETMPVAAFAIEVDVSIGSALAPLATGALGVVESLALPPREVSWFPLPRRDLARLSLLEFERRAAMAAGRESDADGLRLEIAADLAARRR